MVTRKRSKPSSPFDRPNRGVQKPSSPFDRQKPQRNNNKPKKPPGPRSR